MTNQNPLGGGTDALGDPTNAYPAGSAEDEADIDFSSPTFHCKVSRGGEQTQIHLGFSPFVAAAIRAPCLH